MAISALAYLGVRSDCLEDWQNFAGDHLGMQAFDRGGKSMSFRMDEPYAAPCSFRRTR
jgi:hypothetical protein